VGAIGSRVRSILSRFPPALVCLGHTGETGKTGETYSRQQSAGPVKVPSHATPVWAGSEPEQSVVGILKLAVGFCRSAGRRAAPADCNPFERCTSRSSGSNYRPQDRQNRPDQVPSAFVSSTLCQQRSST
jgi:hypothetical protein